MPLSPEELKQAQVADEEIKRRDAELISFPLWWVIGCLRFIILLGAHSGRWDSYLQPIVCLLIGAVSGMRYRRLNRGYPANLKLLEAFCEREPSLFQHANGRPILRKTAKQRRPLLWRVDQFLSRKAVSPERA